MAFLNNFLPIFLWSIKITNFTASSSPELKIILIRLIRLFFQDSFQQRLTPGHLHFEKWISSMFLMTRTLSKNVRIAIVSAGTFTFWKMDFKHVPYDQNIVKKREDRHRSRRDVCILKNGVRITIITFWWIIWT